MILPNPPNAFINFDSSTTIHAYPKEFLESHITLDHPRDNPLDYSCILHQKLNPLDIVVVQPQSHLGDHMFIISKGTLFYGDTMYENLDIKSI